MSLNVFSPHKSEFRFPPVVPRAGCLPPTFSTSTTFHHCDLCGDQADMAIVPPASHTVSCVCALARPLSLSVMASKCPFVCRSNSSFWNHLECYLFWEFVLILLGRAKRISLYAPRVVCLECFIIIDYVALEGSFSSACLHI